MPIRPRIETMVSVGCCSLVLAIGRSTEGMRRSTSSIVRAGVASISALVTTLTLAGTSASGTCERVAVTTMSLGGDDASSAKTGTASSRQGTTAPAGKWDRNIDMPLTGPAARGRGP